MQTVTTDKAKRVRIPDAKPGQVFACHDNGDGSFLLTPVKAEDKEPFPEGSLAKYWTKEKNAEELAILRECVQGPSVSDE